MISARYTDDTNTSYSFILEDGTCGNNYTDGARWKSYEDMRIEAGITPDPFVGPIDMELWKEKMVVSDGPLPRWAEDLIDGAISPQTQKLADEKKALRATKP